MLSSVAKRASGPKAMRAPFAAGTSAGNLKLKYAGMRVVMRWVARETGTLDKFWIKTKALPADGSSYVGGTTANWSWIVKHHPVNQATGFFDPATVLATETFNPNTRQYADGDSQDLQAIGLVCGFAVVKGHMYATTIEPDNADPTTDYASWNNLYTSDGGEGAQTRNVLDKDVYDAFMGIDPRETMGGCPSDGSAQAYPANNFNYPGPFSKHTPTYIQFYADGTAVGQPYYTASSLSAGTAQTMTYQVLRPTVLTHMGAFLRAADSFPAVLKVNGTTEATVTIASSGIKNVRVKLPSPVPVAPSDVITIEFTPAAASMAANYSDTAFRQIMANQDTTGPYFLVSNDVRVAPIFPLPWLPAYEPGFGATSSYLGVRGTLVSSTAGTTQVITLTAGMAAGSRAVVIAGGRDDSHVTTLISAVPSAGDPWTVDAQSEFSLSPTVIAIASGEVTDDLGIGDTVTLTWDHTLGETNEASVHEFAGLLGAADQTAARYAAAATLTPYVGATANTTQDQEMVVAAFLLDVDPARGPITSWTPGSGYAALGGGILQSTGATHGDRALVGCYLPVSFLGPQTARGAITPQVTYNAVVMTYKAT